MSVPAPHFLLISQARAAAGEENAPANGFRGGQWSFVLKGSDGHTELEAADHEPGLPGDRLELLAIVRGLEALDQPSRVTLVTENRSVTRGLRFGLENWRENDWQWEKFGQLLPVTNADLWRRIDHAMQYHIIECQSSRVDAADDLSSASTFARSSDDAQMPDFREVEAEPTSVRRAFQGRELRIDSGRPRQRRGRMKGGSPQRASSGGFFNAAVSTLKRMLVGSRATSD